MTLKIASSKAIRFACMNFHYAKSVPSSLLAFSVFNGNDEFCGVIVYSAGANNNLAKSIGLVQGQCVEIVRMALNGKQESTVKAMAISIRLVKKMCPLVKCVVSFADPIQGHIGTIYQAANFIYLGKSKAQRECIHPKTGKVLHKRTANSLFGTIKGLEKTQIMWKHKYVFCFDKIHASSIKCKSVKYPKHAALDHLGDHLATSQEGAFDATMPLKKSTSKQRDAGRE